METESSFRDVVLDFYIVSIVTTFSEHTEHVTY